MFFLSPHTQTNFPGCRNLFFSLSQLNSCSLNPSEPGSLTSRFFSTGCNGNLYRCETRGLLPKDAHTSRHLQSFVHSVPEHFKHSVIRVPSAFCAVRGSVFQAHVATSLRTDGFPALLLRAHITRRNAGEHIKLSHNYTLRTCVSLFGNLDVKTVGVSAQVGGLLLFASVPFSSS